VDLEMNGNGKFGNPLLGLHFLKEKRPRKLTPHKYLGNMLEAFDDSPEKHFPERDQRETRDGDSPQNEHIKLIPKENQPEEQENYAKDSQKWIEEYQQKNFLVDQKRLQIEKNMNLVMQKHKLHNHLLELQSDNKIKRKHILRLRDLCSREEKTLDKYRSLSRILSTVADVRLMLLSRQSSLKNLQNNLAEKKQWRKDLWVKEALFQIKLDVKKKERRLHPAYHYSSKNISENRLELLFSLPMVLFLTLGLLFYYFVTLSLIK